jgi:phosphomannomutase/phosphoglucomutase
VATGPPEESLSVTVNAKIFREYDIRGIVEEDLDVLTIRSIGRGIGTYLGGQSGGTLAVGRDGRLSSPAVRVSLIDGLRASGCNVIDVGMVPTPILYFALHHLGVQGGVMVTGSHNPPEYNGFKINQGEESLTGEEIRAIHRIIEERAYSEGNGIARPADVTTVYQTLVESKFSFSRSLKVAVDAGNGVAGTVAVSILEAFGHTVFPLYCDPDGHFPNHHPDPSVPENLVDLSACVLREGADLGIAFDGDGDRLGAVDERGNVLWPDQLLILFARDLLTHQPGAPIVFDVKCTQNLPRAIESAGGQPIMWKAGHSLIKKKLRTEDSPLGGEFSGHFFFADDYFGYDDALYAALRLMDLLCRAEKPLSFLLADLPTLHSSPELKFPCPDAEKFQVVEALKGRMRDRYHLIEIDGIRVELDGGWGLIRASNTTPALTARFEAESPERLKAIQEEILDHLKAFSSVEA